MMIAVFVVGLLLSAVALIDDLRRRRADVPYGGRRLPHEIHLVAAMIAGAGAGLAWGSLWGLLVFLAQAVAGVFAAVKLRA
ncbi:MAG TPA: hypothetical protein VF950_17400 [Planctomycetota bacterium]